MILTIMTLPWELALTVGIYLMVLPLVLFRQFLLAKVSSTRLASLLHGLKL